MSGSNFSFASRLWTAYEGKAFNFSTDKLYLKLLIKIWIKVQCTSPKGRFVNIICLNKTMNAMERKVKLFKNNTTKYFLSLINCMKVQVIIYISGKANLIKLKNIISRFWLAGKISNLHSQNRVALTKYSLDTFYGKCTCDCWLMFKTKKKKEKKILCLSF